MTVFFVVYLVLIGAIGVAGKSTVADWPLEPEYDL